MKNDLKGINELKENLANLTNFKKIHLERNNFFYFQVQH